ncbi:hypothetical protein HYH03_001744 [Edaphochlamys debaryana]|uniref:Uncharacterized protein n=1 Tax=Edaphochlamys debaryana TaxID=47281 RepID=A0A835YC08_9CHLO|nr:hypothetical protein HYH03_001744 [Edaphochlamys debaryana]|eukprot:KAG2500162.1 hypothetical protein HYH03_001744 [Edaphochlamys debaryana]
MALLRPDRLLKAPGALAKLLSLWPDSAAGLAALQAGLAAASASEPPQAAAAAAASAGGGGGSPGAWSQLLSRGCDNPGTPTSSGTCSQLLSVGAVVAHPDAAPLVALKAASSSAAAKVALSAPASTSTAVSSSTEPPASLAASFTANFSAAGGLPVLALCLQDGDGAATPTRVAAASVLEAHIRVRPCDSADACGTPGLVSALLDLLGQADLPPASIEPTAGLLLRLCSAAADDAATVREAAAAVSGDRTAAAEALVRLAAECRRETNVLRLAEEGLLSALLSLAAGLMQGLLPHWPDVYAERPAALDAALYAVSLSHQLLTPLSPPRVLSAAAGLYALAPSAEAAGPLLQRLIDSAPQGKAAGAAMPPSDYARALLSCFTAALAAAARTKWYPSLAPVAERLAATLTATLHSPPPPHGGAASRTAALGLALRLLPAGELGAGAPALELAAAVLAATADMAPAQAEAAALAAAAAEDPSAARTATADAAIGLAAQAIWVGCEVAGSALQQPAPLSRASAELLHGLVRAQQGVVKRWLLGVEMDEASSLTRKAARCALAAAMDTQLSLLARAGPGQACALPSNRPARVLASSPACSSGPAHRHCVGCGPEEAEPVVEAVGTEAGKAPPPAKRRRRQAQQARLAEPPPPPPSQPPPATPLAPPQSSPKEPLALPSQPQPAAPLATPQPSPTQPLAEMVQR